MVRLNTRAQGSRSHASEAMDVGRGLQGIVVGKSEEDLLKRSLRDAACHEFLAFVGSRVSLLQVRAEKHPALCHTLLW